MPETPAICPRCADSAWDRGESLGTFFSKLIDGSDFPARWNCGTWTLPVGCLHIVSDFLTFCAYFAIPLMIAFYLIRRRDGIPFPKVAALFAAFIMLCGAGHLIEVLIFWWPVYRLAGLVKLATATVSVITAIVLYRLLPAALELPAMSRVNAQLREEVVQRTAAERAATVADAYTRAILNNTTTVSIIATDPSGVITLFNRGAEQLLGFTADEAVGKLQAEQFHDRAELAERCQAAALPIPTEVSRLTALVVLTAPRSGVERDWTYITRTGERRLVTLTTSRLTDDDGVSLGYLSVAADVTQQRAREHELRKLAIVASKTINAVVIADRHRRVEWVNDSFTKMTGYHLDEVRGRTPGHFLQGPDTNRKTVEAIRAALDAGHVYQGEIFNYDKSGRGYWQALTITPVASPTGEPEGFISVQTDITEIRTALSAADEANRAKSEFLANMSHEIRTPMTAIIGFSEVLTDEIEDPESRGMIESIHRNGLHLLAVINDILDLSKIEAGHVNLRLEQVPVAQTVQDVVDALSIRAVAKSLKLCMQLDANAPDLFRTDVTRFRQILVNLIGNALKFTEAGGVTVYVREMQYTAADRRLAVDVIDTGIGIPLEKQANLFRPFQQVDGTLTRQHGGTGLGLAISRRLAESFGGAIELQSAPGRGSCFTFISGPLDVEEALPAPHGPTTGDKQSTIQGLRIALISSGSDCRKAAEWILRRAGAELTSIVPLFANPHGQPAPSTFDVVLVDLSSDREDCLELAEVLSAASPSAVVVALTPPGIRFDGPAVSPSRFDAELAWPITAARLLPLVSPRVSGKSLAEVP